MLYPGAFLGHVQRRSIICVAVWLYDDFNFLIELQMGVQMRGSALF